MLKKYTKTKPIAADKYIKRTSQGVIRTYSTFHIATFNYPHNWSKAKVLLLLNSALDGWPRNAFTAFELSLFTGLTPDAIKSLLWRLTKYKYVVSGGHADSYGYRVRRYIIGARGQDFIEHIPYEVRAEIIPALQSNVNKYQGRIKW